jgi:hypothetical protein
MSRADPGVLFWLDLSGSRLRLDRLRPQRRQALFAHWVSHSVNAIFETYNRRWRATVETYLGRLFMR